MGKVKFAVVGCGHIGKRHIEMIMRNPETELVAVCDILPEDKLNISHLNIPFYQSISSLLESNLNFDVLNVCTPNGLHAEQAILALKNNKHVVICLLYTSDAADERSSVDLGGRRIIKKQKCE